MKVAGFDFESEEMAKNAEKELQAVTYVKSQTKMDQPDVVLKVYRALVAQNTFSTPVGLSFLEDLQEYLYGVPYIKREDIPLIPIKNYQAQAELGKNKKEAEAKKPKPQTVPKEAPAPRAPEPRRYKTLFQVSLFFAVVFLLIIGGMFTITYLSGNNINIINYENKIIDKYESWEKELEERESELEERESALEQRD